MFVKSGQTKARGACFFSLPRVQLTRRAPCIYRTAAFENRTIGKTLKWISGITRNMDAILACGLPQVSQVPLTHYKVIPYGSSGASDE